MHVTFLSASPSYFNVQEGKTSVSQHDFSPLFSNAMSVPIGISSAIPISSNAAKGTSSKSVKKIPLGNQKNLHQFSPNFKINSNLRICEEEVVPNLLS